MSRVWEICRGVQKGLRITAGVQRTGTKVSKAGQTNLSTRYGAKKWNIYSTQVKGSLSPSFMLLETQKTIPERGMFYRSR